MKVGMINKNNSGSTFGAGTTIINDAGKFALEPFFAKHGNPTFYVHTQGLKNGSSSVTIFRSKDNNIEKQMLSYLKKSGIEFIHKIKKYKTYMNEESKAVSKIVDKQIQKGKFKKNDIITNFD